MSVRALGGVVPRPARGGRVGDGAMPTRGAAVSRRGWLGGGSLPPDAGWIRDVSTSPDAGVAKLHRVGGVICGAGLGSLRRRWSWHFHGDERYGKPRQGRWGGSPSDHMAWRHGCGILA